MSVEKRTKKASGRLPSLTQPIEWMGVAFRVPEDWQIVRHGLSPHRGGLTLVDRRVQRLQLTWSTVEQEPDVERMIDYEKGELSKLSDESDVIVMKGFGEWRLLRSSSPGGRVTTRAVRFDARTSRLVELVVSTERHETQGPELVNRLLGTVRVVCRPEAVQRWRAFDIAFRAPPDYRLTGATVKPADTTLSLDAVDPEHGRELGVRVTVRRMGMAQDWFAGNREAWIKKEFSKIRFESFAESEAFGHRATEAEGLEQAPPFARMLRRQRRRRALVWNCEPENALYLLMTSSPATRRVSPRDFDVDCCARKRHEEA